MRILFLFKQDSIRFPKESYMHLDLFYLLLMLHFLRRRPSGFYARSGFRQER
jgi:hypothetical protein